MPYKIPIGPYHPALEEPYKLTVACKGEIVQGLDIEAINGLFEDIKNGSQFGKLVVEVTGASKL